MIGRFVGVLLTFVPATALAASAAVVTMTPIGDTIPTPTRPKDAVVVALIGGYGTKAEKTEIVWKRYDPATGVHMFPVKGQTGINTLRLTYSPPTKANAATDYIAFVGILPAGDYVLAADLRGVFKMTQFCQGAPVMHVTPGSVTYLGSYRSYSGVKIEGSSERRALGWEGNLTKAKEALGKFPAISSRLVAANIHNGVTFDCVGGSMIRRTAYVIPDMPSIGATDASALRP